MYICMINICKSYNKTNSKVLTFVRVRSNEISRKHNLIYKYLK